MSDPNPLAAMLRALKARMQDSRTPGRLGALPQDVRAWEEELARIEQALASVLGSGRGDTLSMMSGVSHRTGRGFVSLTWGAERGQLTVEECRAHALALLEAAEAAQYDAIFVDWLQREGVVSRRQDAGQLLLRFRAYREQQSGAAYQQEQPLQPPEEPEP